MNFGPKTPKTSDKLPMVLVEKGGRVGASEGIRTLDIHLGKVTLYQAELHSHPYRGRL